MLIFEFIERKDEEYIYAYYPEGDRGRAGRVAITINGNDREGRIIELAENDEFKTYAFHAIYHTRVPEKSGTVAWY